MDSVININIDRKKLSFIVSAISCFLAHGFMLFNAYDVNNMDCYVLDKCAVQGTMGRYIGWFIQELMAGMGFRTVIKPANILVSLIFICLIVVILIELFDIKNKTNIILISMLFPLQPCIIQILGFNFVCHLDLFSMFLMAASIYLIIKKDMKIIPGILLLISIGIYQAYIAFGVFLVFAYCFIEIIKNKDIKDLIFLIIKTIVIFAIVLVIYVIGNKIFLSHFNAKMVEGYQNFGENVFSDIGILGYFGRAIATYRHIPEVIFNQYGRICNFPLLSIVLSLLIIFTIIRLFIEKSIEAKNKIILIVLLLVSPMIFDFSYIMAGISAMRVQTSLFFLVIFPVMILDKITSINFGNFGDRSGGDIFNTGDGSRAKFNIKDNFFAIAKYLYNNLIKICAVIFICMFTFICIAEHYNLMIHSKDYERDVEKIVNMIYNHPDYKDGMRIMVIGRYHRLKNEASARDDRFFNIHDKPIPENMTGDYSLEQYFRLYGSTKVEWIVAGDAAKEYEDMPCYPSDGCIKKISENDIIIKFS